MKKFLCYDTNDAASGKINVNANGVLKPNSTVPSTNGSSYQQLVTDGEGKVKWEDRLAYEEEDPATIEILPETTARFEQVESGIYSCMWGEGGEVVPSMPSPGGICVIKFNGIEYKYVVKIPDEGDSYLSFVNAYAGNLGIVGDVEKDTREPFLVFWIGSSAGVGVGVYTNIALENLENTVSISAEVKIIHKLDEKFLSLPGSSVSIGHIVSNVDGEAFVKSDYIPNTVRVLDTEEEIGTYYDKHYIMCSKDGRDFLSIQPDIFLIKYVGRINMYDIANTIPTSVGDTYSFVERNKRVIDVLNGHSKYLIEYYFDFKNDNIVINPYLSTSPASSKLGNFASAVVTAENGKVYSISLELNSDKKTANGVIKCIA